MEYLNKILKVPHPMEALGLLVESSAQNGNFNEGAIWQNFNNYDKAITITLKGSNCKKTEAMKGNIYRQYEYLRDLIENEISTHTSAHIYYFELHKCGEWVHVHGLISITKPNKTQQALAYKNIRSGVFQSINGRKLKAGETYKNRILIENVHTVETWYNYIKKDEKIMKIYDNRIIKLFKLKSIQNTKICTL